MLVADIFSMRIGERLAMIADLLHQSRHCGEGNMCKVNSSRLECQARMMIVITVTQSWQLQPCKIA